MDTPLRGVCRAVDAPARLVYGMGMLLWYAFLKATHLGALSLLLGGPLFWLCVWPTAAPEPLTSTMRGRIRRGIWLGAWGLVASGTVDVVRAASQVVEPVTLTALWGFLTSTRYGQMLVLKTVCAPLVVASYALLSSSYRQIGQGIYLLSGVTLLTTVSLTSHAAAKADPVALVSDIVHVGSVIAWVSTLLYLAALPWRLIRQDPACYGRPIWLLIERVSTVALLAVCLVSLSGAVLAFLHVYGLVALADTLYGQVLTLKLGLMLLALGCAAWQVLRLKPALRRQIRASVAAMATRVLHRCGRLVRVEAALLLGALCLAGGLTALPPAERPAQVSSQQWTATVEGWHIQLTLTPLDDRGRVLGAIRLTPPEGDARVQPVQSWLHLRMRDHGMGTRPQEATPLSRYQHSSLAMINMAGSWEAEVSFQPASGTRYVTTWPFEARTGSLDQDRTRRLEVAALVASPLATLSGGLGLLLGCLACLTLWASRVGKMPDWALPFGCALFAAGAYLVLRVVLVDAYPTTYHHNPVPTTPDGLRQAHALFVQHCAPCHGLTGQGDGPAAAALSPTPADLTASHVDAHTDGDLFWWLTHGIPGTAMPAWEETFTPTERWMLVQYLRRLRQRQPVSDSTRPR